MEEYQEVEIFMPDGRTGTFVGKVLLTDEEITRMENHEFRVGIVVHPPKKFPKAPHHNFCEMGSCEMKS